MFLKIKLSENNLREKLKKSLDFVKLENMQTLNQNTETILFEATQKFMNFLVNNVLNLLNDQVKAKIHIFNNILNEKTVSLSEKSHILLEYARKIDNTLSEKENLFKNLYSSSTYFSNSDENKIIKVENDNNNSNETLTLESEKESYFSKPCTNISDKNDFNNSTMKVPIVLSDFSQENSFTEVSEFPFQSLLQDVFKTINEFCLNDHLLFQEKVLTKEKNISFYEPENIKKSRNSPKGKNTFENNKPQENLNFQNPYSRPISNNPQIHKNINFSGMDLERETSQIQQINRYNNPNRAYERGITPEKNILIKNIITPSPFAKNISLVSENNKIYFEQSRHGRQLSYHTPCYTRSGYSQFQTNNTVINAVKFVKY